MEKIKLDKDIKVFYVTAESFPDGISAAHQKLHSLIPETKNRNLFGISYPNQKGAIIYKAAVEESYPGEAEKLGCKTFTIKKGEYLNETLVNWRRDETIIGKTFQKLLQRNEIDKNGYCLEMYLNDTDVNCMVPTAPLKN